MSAVLFENTTGRTLEHGTLQVGARLTARFYVYELETKETVCAARVAVDRMMCY